MAWRTRSSFGKPQAATSAYFEYNSEKIFWTEGYSSKSAAQNAIASIQKNGPGADTVDES